MPHQQPEPPTARRPERRARRDPMRTSVRVAIWNAVTALAIIAVLFITFYGLTSQRNEGGQSAATTPMPVQTTGQGGQSDSAK
jgi:hypothetical protein